LAEKLYLEIVRCCVRKIIEGNLENKVVLKSNAAEQSVHLTGGILRHFRAFSTPKQNPALEVLSTSAHPQVTQTVGTPLAQHSKKAKQAGLQRVFDSL
jgi:hypothetical protein